MRLYHYQQTNNVGKIIEPVAWHAQFVIDNSHDYYVRTAAINLSNSSNILTTIQKDPSIAVRVLETSFSEQIAI